jgi:hypothetical protein
MKRFDWSLGSRGDPAYRDRHPTALAGQMFSGGQCWVRAGGHDAGGGGQERGEVRGAAPAKP